MIWLWRIRIRFRNWRYLRHGCHDARTLPAAAERTELMLTTTSVLMPYTPEHYDQTVKWLNDPEINEGFGLLYHINTYDHRVWVATNRHVTFWAITCEGKHVGNILLHHYKDRETGRIQLYLDKAYRGRGLGTAALKEVLEIAFCKLHLHRVWLHLLASNEGGWRFYKRLGFKHEGTEREAIPRNGQYVDQYVLAMLAQEWGQHG